MWIENCTSGDMGHLSVLSYSRLTHFWEWCHPVHVLSDTCVKLVYRRLCQRMLWWRCRRCYTSVECVDADTWRCR